MKFWCSKEGGQGDDSHFWLFAYNRTTDCLALSDLDGTWFTGTESSTLKGFGQLTGLLYYRKDRVTVQEREAEALKQKELEQEAKRMAEERRKYTLKVLGVAVRTEYKE